MKRNNVKSAPPRPNLLTMPRGFPGATPVPAFLAAPSPRQQFDVAVGHFQAGRSDEADRVCATLLSRDPRNADAWHLRGVIAAQAKRFDDAVRWIGKAVEIQPSSVQFYRNLVNALTDSGQTESAVSACRKLVLLQPKVAACHNQLGNLLMADNDPAHAVAVFREAVRLNPNYAEAWNNLGMSLAGVDLVDEAIVAYRQSITLQPMPQTWNNIANCLKTKGQRKEAIASYRIAVGQMPASAEMWNNLGNTLREEGLLQESIDALDRAIQLSPDLASAHWNLALALLQHGELLRGFAEYEWRWRFDEFTSKMPAYPKPQWHGEDVAGKTILLHVEQGRGDVFHFIRYAPLIAERGAKVILHAPGEIARVLQNVPGISRIICDEQAFDFDLHCPVMSLPHVFQTTLESIPATMPYIHPDTELLREWEQRLGPRNAAGGPLRVGLVWAGSAAHKNDGKRSLSLSQLTPMLRTDNITFYTLQKGDAAAQLATLPPDVTLIDHTADLHDFADTAAMIAQLDLVIAVDTAVAHLAGAMGKKIWMLLPFSPDWRWMSDREDSPWYPSMRLFRQRVESDWDEPVARVGKEIIALASSPTQPVIPEPYLE